MGLFQELTLIWRRIKRRKLMISRELGPFNRIFNTSDAFVWSAGSLMGYQIYNITNHLAVYGDGALYSYTFAGIVLFTNVWCYSELMAIQPCMGGPYHFAYNYSGEFVGFIVGWITISYMSLGIWCYIKENILIYESGKNKTLSITGCAYLLQNASLMLDSVFFRGDMAKGIKKHVHFENSTVLNEFPDLLSFLLSLIFSGIVSADTNETKVLNGTLFFLNLCCLTSILILFLGFLDFENWVGLKVEHFKSIMNAFLSTSNSFGPVIALSFLGEEAIEPSKTLPRAEIYVFLFAIFIYTVFPFITTLAWPYKELDPHGSFTSILVLLNVEGLTFIPMIGVTCYVYTSLFLQMMALTRVVCAMARDGLLFRIFSRVEHFNNMPVKPSFMCGVLTGIVAVFGKNDLLLELATANFLFIAMTGPICVLRLRYLDTLDHLRGKVVRPTKKSIVSTNYAQTAITLLVSGAYFVGIAVNRLFRFGLHDVRMLLAAGFGSLLYIITFIYIILLPKNKIISKYRVKLVPVLPAINLLFLAYTLGYVKTTIHQFLAVWLGIGTVFYFLYGMRHSKEEV